MTERIDEFKEEEKEKMTAYDEPVSIAPAGRGESAVHRSRNNWIAGVVLIAIGVVFLFANLTDFRLDNWWALFILIPAVANFGKAWQAYQETGHLDRHARGSITGGLILTLIASAFLFSLDWGLIWPLFLIIGGLAALFGGWFD